MKTDTVENIIRTNIGPLMDWLKDHCHADKQCALTLCGAAVTALIADNQDHDEVMETAHRFCSSLMTSLHDMDKNRRGCLH